VEDVFEVLSTKTREITKYKKGTIPFITSQSVNNGIQGYVKSDEELDKGNCITVSSLDCSSFYQENDFLGRGHGAVNKIYHKQLNKNIALFVCALIKQLGSKYSYNSQCFLNTLKKETILLPTTPALGEPDWAYMDHYIANLRAKMELS
jgi:hypothetical protein